MKGTLTITGATKQQIARLESLFPGKLLFDSAQKKEITVVLFSTDSPDDQQEAAAAVFVLENTIQKQ